MEKWENNNNNNIMVTLYGIVLRFRYSYLIFAVFVDHPRNLFGENFHPLINSYQMCD